MAKKKSKAKAQSSTEEVTVKCLDLRLVQSSSSGTKPRAILSLSDANQLCVRNGDQILMLARNGDEEVKGAIILAAEIARASPSSPLKKSKAAAAGTIQVPASIMETYFQHQSPTIPSTPVEQPLSRESTSFTFRSHSNSSEQEKRDDDKTVSVLALESELGRKLASCICEPCTRLVLERPFHHTKVDGILHRLILATHARCFLHPRQTNLTISYTGKPLELTIEALYGSKSGDVDEADTFANKLLHLSIENDEPLVQAVTQSNVRLFQLNRATTIDFVSMDSDDTKKAPQQETFVAGLDSTVAQLHGLLKISLEHADVFISHNLPVPKGVLMFGESAKTSLCRQVEFDFREYKPVYVQCGTFQSSDVVGQAERRLSKVFDEKPRLLILDDIHGIGSGNDALSSTLLALLDATDSVILAATKDPGRLSPALRRRLDTELEIPLPDQASTRAAILQFHADRLDFPLDKVNWQKLGELAKGFNGADCQLAVKEAVRIAILAQDSSIQQDHLKHAIRSIRPSAISSITVEIPKVYWSDIGGMNTVKRDLREAIESTQYETLGIPPPRGILLYGPPGCSKTLMARALATESSMNFLAVKGPELLSKWLGESERSLASLFRRARLASPCIVFMDELDAVASKRGGSDSNASGRLLSQLLTELDGVTQSKQRVIVVGATNRPDLLDAALTRPGRMDRKIHVGVPDRDSRRKIFQLTLKNRSCSPDIDVDELAELTEGCSGAEIVAIVRDAALYALEGDTESIQMSHLVQSANDLPRQITPDMLHFYESYQQSVS